MTDLSEQKFIDLMNYIKDEKIKYTLQWSEMYLYIRENIPKNVFLPAPAILAAAGEMNNYQKIERFKEQIEIAYKHGLIHKISAQIMNLPDDQLVRYETEKLDPNALSNQSDWMFEE